MKKFSSIFGAAALLSLSLLLIFGCGEYDKDYGSSLAQFTLEAAPSDASGGTVTVVPQMAFYDSGMVVTIFAAPAESYVFTGWSGENAPASNPAQITMKASLDLTANFAKILTEAEIVAGDYKMLDISVKPEAGGSVSVSPAPVGTFEDKFAYNMGDTVTLTAHPAEGYVRSPLTWEGEGLTGNGANQANPTKVVMSADREIVANFYKEGSIVPGTSYAIDFSGSGEFGSPENWQHQWTWIIGTSNASHFEEIEAALEEYEEYISVNYPDAEFMGWWTTTLGGQYGAQVIPSVAFLNSRGEDLLLAPRFKAMAISFDTQGGSTNAAIAAGASWTKGMTGYDSQPDYVPDFGLGSISSYPTKSGFVFGGWYSQPNGEGSQITAEYLNTQALTKDAITIYAHWVGGKTLTIKFDGQKDAVVSVTQNIGGAIVYYPALQNNESGNATRTLSVAEGATVELTVSSGNVLYKFAGWEGDDAPSNKLQNPYAFTMTDDVSLIVTFEEVPMHTFKWSVNPTAGGTFVAQEHSTFDIKGTSGQITIPEGSFSLFQVEVQINAGYAFTGFSGTAADAFYEYAPEPWTSMGQWALARLIREMTDDLELVANFVPIATSGGYRISFEDEIYGEPADGFWVSFGVDPATADTVALVDNMPSASPGVVGKYASLYGTGTQATFTVRGHPDHEFKNWVVTPSNTTIIASGTDGNDPDPTRNFYWITVEVANSNIKVGVETE